MITKRLKITCSKGHKTITGNRNLTVCPECQEHIQIGWKVEHFENLIDQDTKNRTLNFLIDKYDTIYSYPGIAEQGYDDKPAIADNWNNYPNNFTDWLERYFDVDLLWSDEWTSCCDCGKAIRTSPDSYGWEPSFVWLSDCEIVCHECLENEPESFIDEYKNSTDHAVPSWAYPLIEQAGFVCYSPDEYCVQFETGFHPGQNDDPGEVAMDIEENLPGFDYIFKLDSCGQFDIHWSVYIRQPAVEE